MVNQNGGKVMGTAPRMPGKTGELKRKKIHINDGKAINISSAIQYGTLNNYVIITLTEFNRDTGILSYSYLSTYTGSVSNAAFEIFYIE